MNDLQDADPPEILDDMYYFLNEDKSVRPCSVEEFAKQSQEMRIYDSKHVKQEDIGAHWVSTVWLGINHNWGAGNPILFETMILNKDTGEWEDYQVRYTTWDEAAKGHEKAVEWVRGGCKE